MTFRLLTDGTIECGTVDDVLALRERMQRPAPPAPPPEEDPEVRRMSIRVRAHIEITPELVKQGYDEDTARRAVERAIKTIPNGSIDALCTMAETLAAAEAAAAKPKTKARTKAAPRAEPGRKATPPAKAAPAPALADEALVERLNAAGFRRSANGVPAIPQKLAALFHANPERTFHREELAKMFSVPVGRISDSLIRLKKHKFAESRGHGMSGAYRGGDTAMGTDDDTEDD